MAWNDLQPRERKLLVIGLIVIMGVGFYYWVYQPQTQKMVDLKQETEQIIQDLKVKSVRLQRKKELEKKYQLSLKKLNEEHKKFLKREDKTQLIMDLSDLAEEVNIDLMSTNPGSMVKEDIYLEFPVKVKLEGKYNDIIDFARKIEELNYLVRIKNFNIISDLAPSEKTQVEIELVSYAIDRSSGDQT